MHRAVDGWPTLDDYLRLVQAALGAEEVVWHFALGQRAAGPIQLPGWSDLARGARALRDGAAEKLRGARAAGPAAAATVAGAVAGVGAGMLVDGVFGPLGTEALDALGQGPSYGPTQWYPDRYAMALTARRLVIVAVERGVAEAGVGRPKQFLRLGECAQWSAGVVAGAGPVFARETARGAEGWRVIVGVEPARRTFTFRATELAPRNLAEVEAIARRVGATQG